MLDLQCNSPTSHQPWPSANKWINEDNHHVRRESDPGFVNDDGLDLDDCNNNCKKNNNDDGVVDDAIAINESSFFEIKPQRHSSYQSCCYRSLAQKVIKYENISQPFFSVEFFPPRTPKGAQTFIRLLEKYSEGEPYYCDITWHVAGKPWSTLPTSSITIAEVVLNYCHLDTMLHITCIGLTKQHLRQYLDRAKRCGIRSILALRGDKHDEYETKDFKYACDLVSFIREEYGGYFTVVVAGYPIPHPESKGDQEYDVHCLKHKVDAGADFIITQMFFQCEDYVRFVNKCRQAGITVPIIPGICAINTFDSLKRFTELSGVPLPDDLLQKLEPIRQNEQAVQNYGVHYLTELCRQLFKTGLFPGMHFYTLNKDSIIRVIKNLGLWKKVDIGLELPWRTPTHHKRIAESIRPVFWANRPNTYIHRSRHWDRFPITNWSIDDSNSLNDSLKDYFDFLECKLNKHSEELWRTTDMNNIYQIFDQFYRCMINHSDEEQPEITFPWITKQKHFAQYAQDLLNKYGSFIKKGLMVTNYLPRIQTKKDQKRFSVNENYHQKEYIEFFLDQKFWPKLKSLINDQQQPKQQFRFYVCGHSGNELKIINSNCCHDEVLVISWNTFGHDEQQEEKQWPIYIADMKTLEIWMKESFSLFDRLLMIDDNSKTSTVVVVDDNNTSSMKGTSFAINIIQNNFLLVSLIDDDEIANHVPGTNYCSKFENIFHDIFD